MKSRLFSLLYFTVKMDFTNSNIMDAESTAPCVKCYALLVPFGTYGVPSAGTCFDCERRVVISSSSAEREERVCERCFFTWR